MKKVSLLILVVFCAGCATTPRGAEYVPIVDMQGRTESVFNSDLTQCQDYAKRINPQRAAINGAVLGALLGAALAPRGYKNRIAGEGGVIGATAAGGRATMTQEVIIKRCLAGRGYSVLN